MLSAVATGVNADDTAQVALAGVSVAHWHPRAGRQVLGEHGCRARGGAD
jgi:hypothetical protein